MEKAIELAKNLSKKEIVVKEEQLINIREMIKDNYFKDAEIYILAPKKIEKRGEEVDVDEKSMHYIWLEFGR